MEFPYELHAKRGDPMPEGLDVADQAAYIAKRGLYAQVKAGLISLEQGREENQRIMVNYRRVKSELEFSEKLSRHSANMFKGMERVASAYQRSPTRVHADALIEVAYGLVLESKKDWEGAVQG